MSTHSEGTNQYSHVAESPPDDPSVLAVREQAKKSFPLSTLTASGESTLEIEGQPRTIHESTFTINTQHLNVAKPELWEGLQLTTSEEKLFLSRYHPKLTAWTEDPLVSSGDTPESSDPIDNWYEMMNDPNTYVVILSGGLSTNSQRQWNLPFPPQVSETSEGPGSFVHGLHWTFSRNFRTPVSKPENRPRLIVIGISAPGCTGSELAGHTKPEERTIGTGPYAQYYLSTLKYLGIPEDRFLGIGHSHGAEVLAEIATQRGLFRGTDVPDFPQLWLCPSIGVDRQYIFKLLEVMNEIGTRAEKFGSWSEKIVQEMQERITREVLGFDQLGKLSEQQAAILRVYVEEMRRHPDVFKETLRDLTKPQVISPYRIPEMIRIVSASDDVLTPTGHQADWLRRFREAVEQFVLEGLQSRGVLSREQITRTLVREGMQEHYSDTLFKSGGHTAPFTTTEAQYRALEEFIFLMRHVMEKRQNQTS